MEKDKIPVCPGCSRHCALSHVRCGYGRKYIKKLEKKQANTPGLKKYTRRYKWEKYVSREGPMRALLLAASRIKHALRKKEITETQLLSALSVDEQAQLDALLAKLVDMLE